MFGLVCNTEVVEKLGSGWAGWLEIPRLIEDGVVACFDDTAIEINISDILVSSGIAEEDTAEGMAIQLGASATGTSHTYSGSEHLEETEVGFLAEPSFVRSPVCDGVNPAVKDVDSMEKGGGPEFGVK